MTLLALPLLAAPALAVLVHRDATRAHRAERDAAAHKAATLTARYRHREEVIAWTPST